MRLLLLLAACNHAALAPGDVDLAGTDFAVHDLADLAVGAGVEVITCCGGMPPLCMPAPDSGICEPPLSPCQFGGGCSLQCTPQPNYTVPLPPECAGAQDLCKCIMDHGGQDPCFPNGGSSCGPTFGGSIQCLCY
jgi:hypothetical protein